MIYDIVLGGKSYPVKVTAEAEGSYTVSVEDRQYAVDLTEPQPNLFSLLLNGKSYEVGIDTDRDEFSLYLWDRFFRLTVQDPRHKALQGKGRLDQAGGRAEISAPMPGKVVKILAPAGTEVKEGQGVVVVEAMKMENELASPKDGVVKEILTEEGRAVDSAEVLAVVE